MRYENLDEDTRGIIDTMVKITGKTKEQAILALVEFGMLAMIAAISTDKELTMQKTYTVINNDKLLKQTAESYNNYWRQN